MIRRTALLWPLGVVLSVAAHAMLLAGLAIALRPDPVDPQAIPRAQFEVTDQDVPKAQARETPAEGDHARADAPDGAEISQGAIPQSRAQAARPEQARTRASSPARQATAATPPPAQTLRSEKPTGAMAIAAPASDTPAAALAPQASDAIPARLPQRAAASARPATADVAATEVEAPVTVAAASPKSGTAPAIKTVNPSLPPVPTVGRAAPIGDLPAESARLATPSGAAAPQATLPQQRGSASLAWSGDGDDVDPVSLAAIQSFMQPGDLKNAADNAGAVRDGVGDLLASVPCSRIQAAFIPETGKLELRGHVPEDGLRGPILAALKKQMGPDIPVTDNLLILPRPQCGALSGIAAVGLPQSTDQLTDARVVGEDAQVREYRYSEGQRLSFKLNAADYDAFIYVDYFDAQAQVIHLVPNGTVPLEKVAAKTAYSVGEDRDGKPSLDITIGPPFGQEIAVAFASSVPLYDGLRPMVEPADAYLAWLKERVAEARAENPDFKGEWVYFFITTRPAVTQ